MAELVVFWHWLRGHSVRYTAQPYPDAEEGAYFCQTCDRWLW